MNERILYFDNSSEGFHALKLMEEDGYEVLSCNSTDEVMEALKRDNFRCFVSEILTDPLPLQDFLRNSHTFLDRKRVPHIVVTDSLDTEKAALSETYGIRYILFKPLQAPDFKRTLRHQVLNKTNGVLLGPANLSRLFTKSFHSMGYHITSFSKLFEFNMHFSSAKMDFLIFVEGFEGADAMQILGRLNALRIPRVPIYFFLRKENEVLNNIMRKLGPFRMEVARWNWDEIEKRVQELIVEFYTWEQAAEIADKEKKEADAEAQLPKETTTAPPSSEKEPESTKKKPPNRSEETDTGSLSFSNFQRILPQRVGDPKIYTPLGHFMRTGSPAQRERCLEVLNTTEGTKAIQALAAAYPTGNNLLRETLIDLLSEISQNKTVIPILGRALKDRLPALQYQALLGLRNFDLKEVKPLIQDKLKDPNEKVRTMAARILEKVQDITLFPLFATGALQSEDSSMHRSFITYLEVNYQKIKDLQTLTPVFQSKNTALQELVLELLIKHKDSRMVPYINFSLGSGERLLVRLAMDAVVAVPDPSSIPQLLKHMEGPEANNAEKALRAIVDKHGTIKMLQGYLQIMEKGNDNLREYCLGKAKAFSEKENAPILRIALQLGGAGAKLAAIEAMTRWKPENVLLAIGRLLDDPEKGVRDFVMRFMQEKIDRSSIESLIRIFATVKQEDSRRFITQQLATLLEGEDKSWLPSVMHKDNISILVKILKDTGISLGKYTSEVLGEHATDEAAFDVIIRALYDKNDDAKAEAIIVLGQQSNTAAIPHLIKFLDDPNWDVRRLVVEALGTLGANQTGNLIVKKLYDDNANVRSAAAVTLHQFKARYKESLLPIILKEDNTRVAEQLASLLTGFNDPKVADYELPRLSSNYPETRIHAAANIMFLWEELDQRQVLAWLQSDTWSLRLMSLLYLQRQNPQVIEDRWSLLQEDASEKVRVFLVDYLLKENHEKEDRRCEMFLNDAHAEVRAHILNTLASQAPERLIPALQQIIPNEPDDGVMDTVLDLLETRTDATCLQMLEEKAPELGDSVRRKWHGMAERLKKSL